MWLRKKITQEGSTVQALGNMLTDVEEIVLAPVCAGNEALVADDVASRMAEELETCFRAGELCVDEGQILGPAMEALAMDLARRADRAQAGNVVPVENEKGVSLEEEESEVGLHLTKWLRERLAGTPEQENRALVRKILQGLRRQLEEEARHLRRLYMGTIAVAAMGGHDDVAHIEGAAAAEGQAKAMVDEIILHMSGAQASMGSVLDMLQGRRGPERASSSTDGWLQERELLRQWMNEYVEATMRDVRDDEAVMDVFQEEVLNGTEDNMEEEQEITDMESEETEHEGDHAALVQGGARPPWRRDSRERSRSPPPRRNQGEEHEHGDGNDRRPWRRLPRGEGGRGSTEANTKGGGRGSSSRGGPERSRPAGIPRGTPKAMPRARSHSLASPSPRGLASTRVALCLRHCGANQPAASILIRDHRRRTEQPGGDDGRNGIASKGHHAARIPEGDEYDPMGCGDYNTESAGQRRHSGS